MLHRVNGAIERKGRVQAVRGEIERPGRASLDAGRFKVIRNHARRERRFFAFDSA